MIYAALALAALILALDVATTLKALSLGGYEKTAINRFLMARIGNAPGLIAGALFRLGCFAALARIGSPIGWALFAAGMVFTLIAGPINNLRVIDQLRARPKG